MRSLVLFIAAFWTGMAHAAEQRALFEAVGLEVVRAERVTRAVTLEPGHGVGPGDAWSINCWLIRGMSGILRPTGQTL